MNTTGNYDIDGEKKFVLLEHVETCSCVDCKKKEDKLDIIISLLKKLIKQNDSNKL